MTNIVFNIGPNTTHANGNTLDSQGNQPYNPAESSQTGSNTWTVNINTNSVAAWNNGINEGKDFNRRVLQRHLNNKPAVSLIFVVPDHPWTKATKGAAAVRIAMTVCERGHAVGELNCVVSEGKLDTDSPTVEFQTHVGYINSNLTIGPDVSVATVLQANRGIASMGPALGSRGFIIEKSQLDVLKPSFNSFEISRLMTMKHGEDLIREARGSTIIDLNQIQSENELKQLVPHLYQILREKVYPARKDDRDPRLVKYWWKFRRKNAMFRFQADLRKVYSNCRDR